MQINKEMVGDFGMSVLLSVKEKLTSFQIIILGFASVILLGALTLIQIGGLGVITVASFLVMLAGRRISLMQRQTMQNALSVFMATLRKKLEDENDPVSYIQTHVGIGYRMLKVDLK